jgi:hypothetical protein
MGQIDHARARVRSIKTELIGPAPDKQKTYSVEDLVEGLRDGSVSFTGNQLREFAQEWADQYSKSYSYNRTSFESVVLENAFASERAAEKKRFDTEQAIYIARLNKVNDEATKVEDAIVLGDNAAALAALTAFAAFEL